MTGTTGAGAIGVSAFAGGGTGATSTVELAHPQLRLPNWRFTPDQWLPWIDRFQNGIDDIIPNGDTCVEQSPDWLQHRL